jgi:hypothetical protein
MTFVLNSARRKIAEAQSFLGKMTEQDGLMISHGFDHDLSAFLTAGRSVCYGVEVWRKKWENALTSEENHLYDFMRKNRDDEVHHSGAALTVEKEPVKVGGGQYSDKSGTIEVFGPTIALDPDMPNAVVYKTAHYFTINGTKHKATEACAAYLALLKRIVAQCEADHP